MAPFLSPSAELSVIYHGFSVARQDETENIGIIHIYIYLFGLYLFIWGGDVDLEFTLWPRRTLNS